MDSIHGVNSYHPRWLSARLQAALKALPVVVLTGPRQAGKTTLAQSLPADRVYFTLDDVGLLGQAREDPESLLTQRPVTLDEVQRAPDLLLAVKRQVDRKRRAGDFLLTGSANLLLMSRVSESLAGRAVYLELPPFCPLEWLQRPSAIRSIDRLFEKGFDFREWPKAEGDWRSWLLRGGFPPALLAESNEARQLWFGGYVHSYLERDLRQLSAVSNLPDFQRLMALAANRTGRLLNQSELARDAAMPQPTCHRYLNLLETGCLITRLSPYTTNPSTGLVKGKKILWNDCGLARARGNAKSKGEKLNAKVFVSALFQPSAFSLCYLACRVRQRLLRGLSSNVPRRGILNPSRNTAQHFAFALIRCGLRCWPIRLDWGSNWKLTERLNAIRQGPKLAP